MGNGMWKQEARDTTEEPPLINEKLEDERPQESIYIKPHVWNLRREDTDYYKQQRDDFALYGPNQHVDLFSRVGLHCYNLQKGTNLKILKVHKCDLWITSLITYFITFEAMDPIGNSSCEFETQVRYAVENIDCLSAITTRCRLKPKTPEEGDKYLEWNKDLVDNFFTGDMPEWMREDALTGRDKLQYYENEMESAKPFEMKKIVVRTKENVESWKKVKAENAIFYISFKTRCGRDFNCIIRKTTDGKPGHFSLEVKCLM